MSDLFVARKYEVCARSLLAAMKNTHMVIRLWTNNPVSPTMRMFLENCVLQGAPIKNNPLGKIHYLSYCNRFFHQIYSFHKEGFRPHTQQILLQYLLWFKIYNHLNLKVQFISEPVTKPQ